MVTGWGFLEELSLWSGEKKYTIKEKLYEAPKINKSQQKTRIREVKNI